MKTFFIVMIAAFTVAIAGCDKAPQAEFDAAVATVDSVKALPEVAEFAAAEMAVVDSTMTAIAAKMEAKEYEEAKAELVLISPMAKAVVDSAAARKAFAQASGMVPVE